MTRKTRSAPNFRTARWWLLIWPAGAGLVVTAGLLTWTWLSDRAQRQDYVISTVTIVGLTAIVLGLWSFVWLLLLSRLRWRARLGALGAAMALVALAAAALEFRGFSGDLVPVFGWRWAAEALPVEPGGAIRPAGTTLLASPPDYPQFQGPRRDGSVTGVQLARAWTETPRMLWRQPIGAGWSAFAVARGYAVTQEQRGEQELVTCYDLTTGELLWSHADPTRWADPLGGPGPRATPAIHEGRVFALGGTGTLNALDIATGELLWTVDILVDNGASAPAYGVSASPLVLEDTVVVAPGGPDGHALVGYDATTGERRWSGGSGAPAYGSPRHAVLAGVPQILILNDDAVASHSAADGRVLWEFAWPPGEDTFQPVVLPGDRVFVSTGYGVGGKLFRVRAADDGAIAADLVWESTGLKAKFTNVVYRAGYLYGLDDGILACLDPEDGERRWKRGRYGHGQLMLVDDLLVVLGEDGNVALVEAEPEGYRELARFAALEGKTWNHPALSGPYLLVRNDREAACYELPLADEG
jgi:outer membrane protein assembly factor BamB